MYLKYHCFGHCSKVAELEGEKAETCSIAGNWVTFCSSVARSSVSSISLVYQFAVTCSVMNDFQLLTYWCFRLFLFMFDGMSL